MEKNQKKGRVVAGGSTITQQLAKNLFLSPSRSYWRKAEEAVITVMLEAHAPEAAHPRDLSQRDRMGQRRLRRRGGGAAVFRQHPPRSFRRSRRRGWRRWRPIPRFYERNQAAPGLNRKIGIILARMPGAEIPVASQRLECGPTPRLPRGQLPAAAKPCPSPSQAKEIERPEARERVQDALAEITALLRKHRLVEGLVHEQLEHAPVGDNDRPRRDRREPRHQAEPAQLHAQARPAAPGRHRVHPRGAAARRAPVHLGPGARGARRRDPARGFRRRSANR